MSLNFVMACFTRPHIHVVELCDGVFHSTTHVYMSLNFVMACFTGLHIHVVELCDGVFHSTTRTCR